MRLPRLVGLPKALEIILTGKQLAGVPARKKAGLVDEIAYPEGMLVHRRTPRPRAANVRR